MQNSLGKADLVIVGAGFFGLTIAEQAASQGARVVIIEKRDHLGGNAYSYVEPSSGIEVHKYGSHLFHTSNKKVWDYVNRFTRFNEYRHQVYTTHKGKIYSMPINLETMCSFFGLALTPKDAHRLISEKTSPFRNESPSNLEEKALSSVGVELYEAFIKGYTQKQWETDPIKLPSEIISRLPVRFTFNNRYFSDTWEGLPSEGYGSWFNSMVAHGNIEVKLNADFFELRKFIPDSTLVVYTGALDRYFDYSRGELGWRTLDLSIEVREVGDFQGTAVMNYSDVEIPYTRVHEFRHLHPERKYQSERTVVMYEFSRVAQSSDEPYYPINTSADRALVQEYRELASKEKNVIFGGRLGSYQYLDMHMAIASALTLFENEISPRLRNKG
jgi:UDP-galactopyranose mutase